jgi:hypothetical protein
VPVLLVDCSRAEHSATYRGCKWEHQSRAARDGGCPTPRAPRRPKPLPTPQRALCLPRVTSGAQASWRSPSHLTCRAPGNGAPWTGRPGARGTRPRRRAAQPATASAHGVVFMQAPRGRQLAWIIERTAVASAAVCDAICNSVARAEPNEESRACCCARRRMSRRPRLLLNHSRWWVRHVGSGRRGRCREGLAFLGPVHGRPLRRGPPCRHWRRRRGGAIHRRSRDPIARAASDRFDRSRVAASHLSPGADRHRAGTAPCRLEGRVDGGVEPDGRQAHLRLRASCSMPMRVISGLVPGFFGAYASGCRRSSWPEHAPRVKMSVADPRAVRSSSGRPQPES